MPRIAVANYLGPALDARLSRHAANPLLLPVEPGRAAWDLPPNTEVLFTSPSLGWKQAPTRRPASWPHTLRWVQLSSTGIDTFPAWLFDGPTVTCGRGVSAIPIAEYVMAAILGREKRLETIRIREASQWRTMEIGGLSGKSLGLLGYGSVGRAIADRARAFGMTVTALRATRGPIEGVVGCDTVADLLALSDYLVLAAPLTAATLRIVNADSLRHAKAGLHIINISRGPLIDQQALLDALDAGRLSGATLDVTDPEPLPAGHPLYTHPAVRITPHISYVSSRHWDRLADLIMTNFDRYASWQPLTEIVDPARGY